MRRLKAKHLELTPSDLLFLLMEENAAELFGNKKFWPGLHQIDLELTRDCIQTEEFKNPAEQQKAVNMETGRSSADAFNPGEKTIVIKLKTKETAVEGAYLLNQLFKGTGTEFIAEMPEGSDLPQIRSNIDKRHASKLSVMSKFFFERDMTLEEFKGMSTDAIDKMILEEIRRIPAAEVRRMHPDDREDIIFEERQKLLKEEREKSRRNNQGVVDTVLEGDPFNTSWQSRMGVLPFVSLMGTHGRLRPAERHSFSVKHKEKELNERHERGDPRLFEQIVVHVEMNHDGEIYTILYSPLRDAYEKAQGHVKALNFLFEVIGGDPSDPDITLPVRTLRALGFVMGVKGAFAGELFTPEVVGIASALVFGSVMLKKHSTIEERIERLLTWRQRMLAEARARSKSEGISMEEAIEEIAFAPLPRSSELPPEVHELHLGSSDDAAHVVHAVDGETLRGQAIRRILENGNGSADQLTQHAEQHLHRHVRGEANRHRHRH